MSQQPTEKFDLWCIVELMGHQRIAGRCTEKSIAGVNMLQVDVPETKDQPAFTKFYGGTAIYAINPVDEQTCRATAHNLNAAPINAWNLKSYMDKYEAALKELPSHADKVQPDPDDDDDYNPYDEEEII